MVIKDADEIRFENSEIMSILNQDLVLLSR